MVKQLAASLFRPWRLFVAGGVLLTALQILLPGGAVANASWALMVFATIGALLFGKRVRRPDNGAALQLLAAGQAAFAVATGIFAVYDLVHDRPAPFPSVADPVYLLGNVLITAALVALGRERSRDRGPLLEAAFFAVAFSAAAWFVLIAPNIQDATRPSATRIVSAVYPITDVLMLAAVVLLVMTPGRRPVSFLLIASGALLNIAADLGYAWGLLHDTHSSDSSTAIGWLLAFICFGAAALHPSMAEIPRHIPDQIPTLPIWRLGLLGATAIATPFAILATHDQTAVNLVVISAFTFALFTLALLRANSIVRSADRATARLLAAEAENRALIEQVPAAIYTHGIGEQATTFFVNAHTEALLGYTRAEWTANPGLWAELLHPADRERLFSNGRIEDRIERDIRQDEYRLRTRDGRYVWLRDESVLIRDAAGAAAYWQGVAVDVTAERAAQESVREAEQRFRLLFSSHPHPMWVYDLETLRFLEVNDAAVDRYGYRRDEFLSMTILAIRPAADSAKLLDNLRGERPPLEYSTGWRHQTKDGRVLDVDITSHTLAFAERAAALVVAQDVTERKALERQLAHQALHDALTGLPNRALFNDRLEHALAAAGRRGRQIGVLFLDLDRFKLVNDGLGHEAGDQLLIEVAARLRSCLRADDTLARFGGDEFVVLLDEVVDPASAEAAAARIVEAVGSPVILDTQEITIGISVGVALARSGANPGDLLREADVAMYHAKRHRLGYALFRPELGEWARERLGLEAELRHAIAEGGLLLHYQPIVELDTERVLAVEALVRWSHPERGLIPPHEFIPIAEESGLIAPLGRWVLIEACRQLAAWRATGVASPDLGINVNLSARQVACTGIVADVAEALAASGISPTNLELEITETVAMAEDERTIATLRRLGELGVRLAVDDFGAGASPLGYLRRCPVDALKIDRSFVTGLASPDAEGERMIRAVLAFAATLGMEVTAEGIETEAQANRLLDIGCLRGQGYLFARPQPPDVIAALLSPERSLLAATG